MKGSVIKTKAIKKPNLTINLILDLTIMVPKAKELDIEKKSYLSYECNSFCRKF